MNTPTTVTASITGAGYTTTLGFGPDDRSARFNIAADEPESLGGADTGPTPVELLLASLASCKAITMQMYAQRKHWTIHRIDLSLTATLHDNAPTIESIDVSINIDAPALDDAQAQRVKSIASKCPVHRALETGIQIRTD